MQTIAEQLFFVTIRAETQVRTGTAFLYQYVHDSDSAVAEKRGLFVVTNAHMLYESEWIRLTFHRGEDGLPVLGKRHVIQLPVTSWYIDDHENVDIAVLPLSAFAAEADAESQKYFIKAVTHEVQSSSAALEVLDAIEDVVFIGYPNDFYDRVYNLPIARRGVTASPIAHDFEDAEAFVISAPVFPGSSGSPVFIVNSTEFRTRSGNLVQRPRTLFLGILSEFRYREAGGWFEFGGQSSKDVSVAFQESIDIGIVRRESVIRKTIRSYLGSVGVAL